MPPEPAQEYGGARQFHRAKREYPFLRFVSNAELDGRLEQVIEAAAASPIEAFHVEPSNGGEITGIQEPAGIREELTGRAMEGLPGVVEVVAAGMGIDEASARRQVREYVSERIQEERAHQLSRIWDEEQEIILATTLLLLH